MTQFSFLGYVLLILASLVFSIAFIIYTWRNRQVTGAVIFMLWLVSTTGWMIAHQMLFVLSDPSQLMNVLRAALFFQVFLPPAFLLFAIHYTGRQRWYAAGRQAFLFVIPLMVFLISLNNAWSGWIWKDVQFSQMDTFLPVLFEMGWLYLVFWLYAYLCFTAAVILFYHQLKISGQAYRRQVRTICLAAILPPLLNASLIIFPGSPLAFNMAPLGFAIGSIFMAFAFFRYRLFDLKPVTYYSLIEKMPDAILILDRSCRILHLNQKSAELFGLLPREVIGETLSIVLPEGSPWLQPLRDQAQGIVNTEHTPKGQTSYYQFEATYFPDEENWHEKMVVIKDITREQHSKAAEQLARQEAEIRAMELDVLRKIAERLNQMADLEQVTSEGLKEIISWLGARFAYVILANGSGRPQLAGSINLPPLVESAFERFSFCPSCKTFEQFMQGKYQEPVSFLPCPILDQVSISYPGLLSIPLHLGERQFGVLNLVMAPNAVFTGDEIRLLQTIGDQYSAALERARLFEDAERMATLDTLTGLYNRRHFFQLSQAEFDRSCRHNRPISVVMLDIDHFKRVNDTFGHLVGDQVLQKIALTCRSALRSSDIIGRYGGEEFVILLPETDLENARQIANRIRSMVMDRPVLTDRGEILLTVSLGAASMEGDCEVRLEQVLDRADQALYKAKQLGRNRVSIWQDPFLGESLLNYKPN